MILKKGRFLLKQFLIVGTEAELNLKMITLRNSSIYTIIWYFLQFILIL
jgi:hypothetical protein